MNVRDLKKLSQWFSDSARILPWRHDPSPYRVWISEIMLQQTQVITVVPFFEKFMGRFHSVESLAAAPQDEVLKYWSGLGYYSRARNIHKAAEIIVRDGFPQDRSGWESLPGVGPYTAGAILSIAFGMTEAIVDGNVERVLSRVHRFAERNREQIWNASWDFIRTGVRGGIDPSTLNQSLMELGARVCKPRDPLCAECPLRGGCEAFAAGDVEKYPAKKERAKSVVVRESCSVWVTRDRKVLIELDERAKWRKGLWDLPDAKSVLAHARLVKVPSPKLEVKYVVTKHKVTRSLKVKYLRQSSKELKVQGSRQWISFDAVGTLPHGASLRKSLAIISQSW